MYNNKYEDRLREWAEFRTALEDHPDPLQAVIDQYRNSPLVNISTDPWDRSTWPDPWELINENQYCDFSRVLGMCYSLQLTDRFKGSNFEIHIGIDNEKSITYYLLYVDNAHVLGLEDDKVAAISSVPETLVSQIVYQMPSLQ